MVEATPTSSDPETTGTRSEGLTGLLESLEQFRAEFESHERILTDLRAALTAAGVPYIGMPSLFLAHTEKGS